MKIHRIQQQAVDKNLRDLMIELDEAEKELSAAINNGFSQHIIAMRRAKFELLRDETRELWAKVHGFK